MNEQIKRMQQKLKKHLDEDRYEHLSLIHI